jgi:integrase
LPDGVTEFRDRHGKWRCRFRRKGRVDHYFKAERDTADWWQEYAACLNGEAAPKLDVGSGRTKPGSVSAVIIAYYLSPEFLGLAPSTKVTYRRQLERFRHEHGDKRIALIQRQHIKAILGRMAATPAAANNLLDLLKTIMRFAVDIGMRSDNPTVDLRGYSMKGDGFHTWTEAEIARYEATHPVGGKARLAMALLLYTGQRRSDVVGMGWQHVTSGRITVVQQKTGARLEIPMHPALVRVLADTPRDNLTFLVTAFGRPYSAAGFGNWFREQCDAVGLSHCSAHGLRKAASRRLAEAGCSNQLIKSITGHKTNSEVSRYTAAADQVRLADQAIGALGGADG